MLAARRRPSDPDFHGSPRLTSDNITYLVFKKYKVRKNNLSFFLLTLAENRRRILRDNSIDRSKKNFGSLLHVFQ